MRVRRLGTWLMVAVLGLMQPALARDLRGVALVVGESDYASLKDLGNPEHDARAMDDLLDELGFDVSRVLDGDKARLEDRIDRFVEDAADADVALVYYSGHGIEAGGRDYLVPVDADISSPEEAGASLVPLDDLLARLARTVPVTIVLLDACRTDAFPEGTVIALPGSGGTVSVAAAGLGAVRGPVPVAKASADPDGLGMVIGFAASPGQAALDGPPDGNSPYAAALLKHLSAGGYSFADLMTMVTEEVYLKTGARQLPWTNSSLRRVLSFGRPAPAADADEAAIAEGRRKLLLSIAALPEADRKQVETAAHAGGVPMDALYGLLQALGADAPDDPAALGKLLQAQTERLRQIMAEQSALASTDPEIVRLSTLAQKALAEGALDANVRFWEAAKARYAEISRSLDATEAQLRARRLEGGALLAKTAEAYVLKADYRAAAENYAEAYEQVARWDADLALHYKWEQAGELTQQGDLRGDNQALQDAVAAYREALRLAPRDMRPKDWAGINSDLSIPLSALYARSADASYLQAAADATRAALSVLDRQADPQRWAIAENNLGTALNDLGLNAGDVGMLKDAIAAFRGALEIQTRDADPTAWAMAQTNLGTALDRVARVTGEDGYYEQAIVAYRSALEVETRASNPLGWADNQINLGVSLEALGAARNDLGLLRQAAEAMRQSLEERKRELVPVDWAASQMALGFTLQQIGERTHDEARLEEAEAAYRAALEEYRPDRGASSWAHAKFNLGNILYARGMRLGDMDLVAEAADDFKGATGVWSDSKSPVMWAMAETNLGNALWMLQRSEEAIEAYRASQRVYTQKAYPMQWAMAENNAGWLTALVGYSKKDRLMMLSGKISIATSAQVYEQLNLPRDPKFFDERIKSIDAAMAGTN